MEVVIDPFRKDFINKEFLDIICHLHVLFFATLDDVVESFWAIRKKIIHIIDEEGFAGDFSDQFNQFGFFLMVLLMCVWAASMMKVMFKVISFLLVHHINDFILADKFLLQQVQEMSLLLRC